MVAKDGEIDERGTVGHLGTKAVFFVLMEEVLTWRIRLLKLIEIDT